MNPPLLIAEDDADLAKRLTRFFARSVEVVAVRSTTEATAALAAGPRWCGALVDVNLPDGSGLDVLDAFRTIEPTAPALVLTGHCDPTLINHAQRRRAEYAVKPAEVDNLRAFLAQVSEHRVARERDVETLLDQLSTTHKLSPAERRILDVSVRGTPRKRLADELGLTDNTVKTQLRSLLRKCDDAEELGEVVRSIWERATAGRDT
jgi:DNA-binding NarL/FixJ family response regulator